mgnify:CR=1 FL=1
MNETRPTKSGWIEVVVGPMYSGKTEELIRRLRRAQIARQKVEIFKPAIDTRYGADHSPVGGGNRPGPPPPCRRRAT